MGDSKLHHYVPQFYLQNFSTDINKKVIGLYNCQNGVFILNAPIRKQAREKNLYGNEDSIEKALSELEYYSSLVLARLLQILFPPPPDSTYFILIKKYILYQSLRTLKAGNDIQDKIKSGTKELFSVMSKTNPKFKDVLAKLDNPVIEGLVMAEKGLPLLEYLDCKILINQTTIPFITSDNPVAKYNQFVEVKNVQGGIGWAVKGFQIFFPLSPGVMLVLFDRFVYNYGTKKQLQILLTSEEDINQLNVLQYFSCKSQLFFGNGISERSLKEIVKKNSSAKRVCRETTFSKERELPNGEKSVQLLFTSIDPKIKLKLSFSTFTKRAKKFSFAGNYSCVRHESLNRHRASMKD